MNKYSRFPYNDLQYENERDVKVNALFQKVTLAKVRRDRRLVSELMKQIKAIRGW